MGEFARRNDAFKLNLAVHNREELLHQLANNLTDLAIMVRPPQDLDTHNEPFSPHPYVIVAPPRHPLVGKKRIPQSTIAKGSFIVREKGLDTRHSMEDEFARGVARLNVAMEIRSAEPIKQAVIAGMGISFLSAHIIGLELQVGHLAVLDVQGFPVMLDRYVVHRKSKRLPAVALAFKEFLIGEGATQIAQITHVDTDLLRGQSTG